MALIIPNEEKVLDEVYRAFVTHQINKVTSSSKLTDDGRKDKGLIESIIENFKLEVIE